MLTFENAKRLDRDMWFNTDDIYFGWDQLSFAKRDRLPEQPGLYAVVMVVHSECNDEGDLYDLGNILYIGRSDNLHKRWKGKKHHKWGVLATLPNIQIHYNTGFSLLKAWESALIEEFNPPLNYTRSEFQVLEEHRCELRSKGFTLDYQD